MWTLLLQMARRRRIIRNRKHIIERQRTEAEEKPGREEERGGIEGSTATARGIFTATCGYGGLGFSRD